MPMNRKDSVVRARIRTDIKEEAQEVLDNLGLTMSDAIQILFRAIAKNKRLPDEFLVPNETTLAAMSEIEASRFVTYEDLKTFKEDVLKRIQTNEKSGSKQAVHQGS